MDLVDDAVVAGTDSPFIHSAHELLGPVRAGLVGEQLDGR